MGLAPGGVIAVTLATASVLLPTAGTSPSLRTTQPTFRAAVEVVQLNVSVQHAQRTTSVPPLGPEDFVVEEDGVRQVIDDVSHDPKAISLLVALDVSGSMRGRRRELAAESVRTLFSVLESADEVSLMVFARDVSVPLKWISPVKVPGLDWAQWVIPDETALFDGVRAALGLMDAATRQQRAVVVVSDGGENGSAVSLSSLVATRRQSETQIFGFLTDVPDTNRGQLARDIAAHMVAPPQQALSSVVGDSGGLVYSAVDSERIVAATLALVSDLRGQFTLSYRPKVPMDGGYRRLRVSTVRKDLRVRHRGGYLALPSATAKP